MVVACAAVLTLVAPPANVNLSPVRAPMTKYKAQNSVLLGDFALHLQSGNPIKINNALAKFAKSFNSFVNDEYGTNQSLPYIQAYARNNGYNILPGLSPRSPRLNAMNALLFVNAGGLHNATKPTLNCRLYFLQSNHPDPPNPLP